MGQRVGGMRMGWIHKRQLVRMVAHLCGHGVWAWRVGMRVEVGCAFARRAVHLHARLREFGFEGCVRVALPISVSRSFALSRAVSRSESVSR